MASVVLIAAAPAAAAVLLGVTVMEVDAPLASAVRGTSRNETAVVAAPKTATTRSCKKGAKSTTKKGNSATQANNDKTSQPISSSSSNANSGAAGGGASTTAQQLAGKDANIKTACKRSAPAGPDISVPLKRSRRTAALATGFAWNSADRVTSNTKYVSTDSIMNVSNASSDAVAGTAKSTSKSNKIASNTTKKDAAKAHKAKVSTVFKRTKADKNIAKSTTSTKKNQAKSMATKSSGGSAEKALRRSPRLANGHKPAILNTAVSVAVNIAIAAVGRSSTSVKSNGMDIAKGPLAQAVAFHECMTGSNDGTSSSNGSATSAKKRTESRAKDTVAISQDTKYIANDADRACDTGLAQAKEGKTAPVTQSVHEQQHQQVVSRAQQRRHAGLAEDAQQKSLVVNEGVKNGTGISARSAARHQTLQSQIVVPTLDAAPVASQQRLQVAVPAVTSSTSAGQCDGKRTKGRASTINKWSTTTTTSDEPHHSNSTTSSSGSGSSGGNNSNNNSSRKSKATAATTGSDRDSSVWGRKLTSGTASTVSTTSRTATLPTDTSSSNNSSKRSTRNGNRDSKGSSSNSNSNGSASADSRRVSGVVDSVNGQMQGDLPAANGLPTNNSSGGSNYHMFGAVVRREVHIVNRWLDDVNCLHVAVQRLHRRRQQQAEAEKDARGAVAALNAAVARAAAKAAATAAAADNTSSRLRQRQSFADVATACARAAAAATRAAVRSLEAIEDCVEESLAAASLDPTAAAAETLDSEDNDTWHSVDQGALDDADKVTKNDYNDYDSDSDSDSDSPEVPRKQPCQSVQQLRRNRPPLTVDVNARPMQMPYSAGSSSSSSSSSGSSARRRLSA
eukprot:18739-Heterococcus_DN1.PRE.1